MCRGPIDPVKAADAAAPTGLSFFATKMAVYRLTRSSQKWRNLSEPLLPAPTSRFPLSTPRRASSYTAAHSRLVKPWSSSAGAAARRANPRLYDRAPGCCRAELGARLALSSGGGAATLRLMSFRLPCSEGRGTTEGVARVKGRGGGGAEMGRRGMGRSGR